MASSESLDNPQFYYQNAKTGAASSTALSIRQICRLLIPIREGQPPILTGQTMVIDTLQEKQEWQPVNAVPILKEASTLWYHHCQSKDKIKKHEPSQKAVSCRELATLCEDEANDVDTVLVFAQGVTSEWTPISKLPNLKLVFQALQQVQLPPDESNVEADTAPPKGVDEADKSAKEVGVQSELEQFLKMTNHMGEDGGDADDDAASYQSDGGTRYIQDPVTKNWIHEAIVALNKSENKQAQNNNSKKPAAQNSVVAMDISDPSKKKKKHKKAQFAKKNAKCWVYITGLPQTTTDIVTDVAKYFGKAGLIDLDPETLQPKIKLYSDKATGKLKGDASICYARPESVDLALQVLDQSPWDDNHTLSVQRAHFEAKKDDKASNDGSADNDRNKRRKRPVSDAQRKVARLALLQAQDEGFGERLAGGRKGLRIVIVECMVNGLEESKWESSIHDKCEEECGAVEKITVLSKNNNVVIVKFIEPTAASKAVEAWNRKLNIAGTATMACKYWDGVTDYTNSHKNKESHADEKKRHSEFGSWLEDQELPSELQLQVEGGK